MIPLISAAAGSEVSQAANARSRAARVSGVPESEGEKPSMNFEAFSSWVWTREEFVLIEWFEFLVHGWSFRRG
jgi:hypothetical protein